MLEKIRIIFSITELRKKILLTLALLAVYRLGWNIMLPIVTEGGVKDLFGSQAGFSDLLNAVSVFSGSQLDQMTIFGLGIMPYISASIIFQLLATVIPALDKIQKDGESGRKKINEWTRYATIAICLIQSFFYIVYLNQQQATTGTVFIEQVVGKDNQLTATWFFLAVLTMTTGTAFLMWLGEQIDEYGIGNGISLLIMAGILARAPSAFYELYQNTAGTGAGLTLGSGVETLVILAVLFVFVVGAVVFVTKGQRRIATNSAKHVRGRQVYGGARQYLPLRVNQAGVMPIIFASSLMMFPAVIFTAMRGYINNEATGFMGFVSWCIQTGDQIFARQTFTYVMLEILLIYFFCYFWTAVTFNPKDMAENLKNQGTFIKGLRPGKTTADYLEKVMIRITYVGASFLAIVAIVPTLITSTMGVSYSIASFFGGTSLLIAVSVVIDLVDKIDAHLIMRNYKGLLDKS